MAPCGSIFRFFYSLFPLVLMGGQTEGLACADPGARTPIGASGIFLRIFSFFLGTTVIVVGFQIFAWAPKKK